MNLYVFFAGYALSVSLLAGNLNKSISFYEDCEDLKSPSPGVTISSSIAIEDKGKYGKCMRIERRTVNALANGDFKQKDSDAWLYRDNAVWLKNGGINNSSCLQISGGEIVVPVTGLKKDSVNAFSFYAKSPGQAVVSVSWDAAGKETSLVKDVNIGKSFVRVKVPFRATADAGSLRIQVKGVIIIDNAQLDKGVSFFNSFSSPLQRRSVDRIEIPANGKYFAEKQGAISVWLNVPWLNDKETVSDSICGLFVVDNAEKRKKKWGDHVIMGINCIPRKKYTDNSRNSQFHFYTIDAKNRVCPISLKLQDMASAAASGWRHVVCNWQLTDDGKMKTELWLDGKKQVERIKPFGPVKKQKFIWIGYANGAYLNGLMDDLAIFNRPLTADEIQQINSSDKPVSQL